MDDGESIKGFEDEFVSKAMENGEDVEFFEDDFVSEAMDDGEDIYRYRHGGLHPVHIGDRLDGTRYNVIKKLGQGASSTVWLARDFLPDKYIAVKIKESDLSSLNNELNILEHLSEVRSDHPGRIYSSASLLLRHFWIAGPNGRHLALVFQVRGPSIPCLSYLQVRLHTCLARNIALQVTQGLEYLHSEGICHGDFNSSDVLFQLTNFDSWSEDELQAQLGKPRMFPIERGHGRPHYLVDSASFFDAEPRLLTKNITIVDHSESFFVKSPPSHELRITNHFTAPEVLCGWDASFHSDIWALGCLIFEMRAGYHLFTEAAINPPLEAVGGIIDMLGSVPSSWNHVRFNEEGYLEQDGCHAVDFTGMARCPESQQVNWIEDEQIGPPNVNGLKESNPRIKKAKVLYPSDLSDDDFRKGYPITYWCSFPLGRTARIYLIECSSTQWLVRAAIKKDMAPFQISVKESTSLTDLLSKIFTYKPGDRISLRDITTHRWVTDSVESTQKTTKI